jgi:hypothetical protein
MDMFSVLLQREAIIATAIVGAVLATLGSLRTERGRIGPVRSSALVKAGYGITAVSMLLMIVAGFLSGR